MSSGPLKVLSLGAGVQSSVVLLMSCLGVLPKLDAAIFADTHWEPADVYSHLTWLEQQAELAGIPVHRVSAGDLRKHAIEGRKKKTKEGTHFVSLPIFTVAADGSRGIVTQRQCTRDYKIRPIQRKVRELLGLRKGQRWPGTGVVEQWFGISADEAGRVRISRERGISNRYPLVYELGMSRADCLAWAARNYPGRPFPRSACIGCPFHQNDEWQRIKADPAAWADAVDADRKVRREARGHRTSTGYLHFSFTPLEEADLTFKPKAPESLSLWRHECMGLCGV